MAALAPPANVEAPQATPPLHSLVTSAILVDEPDNRWSAGFTFNRELCTTGNTWIPCEDDQGSGGDTKPGGDAPPNTLFLPMVVWDEFSCNAQLWDRTRLSEPGSPFRVDFEARARRRLEASQVNQVEQELWTGAVMGGVAPNWCPTHENMSLIGSTELGDVLNSTSGGIYQPVNSENAIGLLQQALSNCNGGNRGMIHATPLLVEKWMSDYHLKEDGARLVTMNRGNVVVSGGGYPGTQPTDVVQPLLANEQWAYATGMVTLRLGEVMVPANEPSDAMDRTTNEVTVRVERFTAAVWDLCCTFAVLVNTCSADC